MNTPDHSSELRPDLDEILRELEEATLVELERIATPKARTRLKPDKKQSGALHKLPIILKGEIIGYHEEPVPDYRLTAEQGVLRSIRQLRHILQEGTDIYRAVWLAMSVGAGTTLPDSVIARLVRPGRPPNDDEKIQRIHRRVTALLNGEDETPQATSTDATGWYRAEKAKRGEAVALPKRKPPTKEEAYRKVAEKEDLTDWKQVSRIYLEEEKKRKGT